MKADVFWRIDTRDVLRQLGDGEGVYVFKSNLPLIEWTKKLIKDGIGKEFEIDEESHPTKVIFNVKWWI